MCIRDRVSTFAISRMLGGGTELLLGDLIERQFLGGAYNPQLGAAISLVTVSYTHLDVYKRQPWDIGIFTV